MKQLISISESLIDEALSRAKEQEAVYGHNTGHFTLKTEKENTIIGVIGELTVRNWLNDSAKRAGSAARFTESNLGAPIDLILNGAVDTTISGLHVKTGLWRNWPTENLEFGIHADQGIESSGQPLVLVTLLKSQEKWPKFSRIEGFISCEELAKLPIIRKGEKFKSSGVISRTDNIVTSFGQYKPIAELSERLFKV